MDSIDTPTVRREMAWLAAMMFVLICTFTCTTFARSQSLDLQEQCASQARKTFGELKSEYKEFQSPLLEPGPVTGDYQSHYNTKLKRCLMLITLNVSFSTPSNGFISEWRLVDANERRYYAFYSTSERKSLPVCELTPSFVQKRPCKTREEFDAFVAPYMED